MAREQPLLARDFLGLGNMVDAPQRNDAEERQYRSTFLDLKSNDLPPKLNESSVSGLGVLSTSFVKNNPFLRSIAAAGLSHSMWSKAASNQQLFPHRNSSGDRFVEQSAENVPEKLFPHFLHPVQTWMKSPQARDNCGPSKYFSNGFGETMPSLTIPDVDGPGNVSESLQKRVLGSGLAEKLGGEPLTIFYGGNVNVFNDVSEEKAKAIIFLAGGGAFQGTRIGICPMAANPSGSSVRLDLDHASVPAPGSPDQPVVPRALPQARKASLARFLEKRRERIQSKAPYLVKQTDSSSLEERFSSSNGVASHKACKDADDKKLVTIPNWMERTSEHSTCDMAVKE